MLDKRRFTISIGEYGVIVALHSGNEVKNKILISTLTEENKPQLIELFTKNKSVPTYILVDTSDQNYKKKSYPLVSKLDFQKMIKRDLHKEFERNEKSLQSYYGVRDRISKAWDCVFVSAPEFPETSKWIDFLLELPNEFVGAYMLPIETEHLAELVFKFTKAEQKLPIEGSNVLSFITQNKVSGVRQVVFFNHTIVFTRVVNYDFEDHRFADKFEQDIFRTNEYLKMLFPKIKAQDVTIINVLSEDVIEKIKHIKSHELSFINYSPYQIATKLGISNIGAKNNSNFSDLIIANCFANANKKILKLSNPKISLISRLRLIIKSSFAINSILTIGIFTIFIKLFLQENYHDQAINLRQVNKMQLEENLKEISKAALDLDGSDKGTKLVDDKSANEIIDFGKVNDVLSKADINIGSTFGRLSLIRQYGAIIDSFTYQIPNYNPKEQNLSVRSVFVANGDISDASGDIEVLFRKFDSLTLATKKSFPEYKIRYSELSKNIDFSKKYYSFPFDLTMDYASKDVQ